jgi:antitoxin component YwqK of YwqJK toxin-antitoxin module
MKYIKLLLLFFLPFSTYSQSRDSANDRKWNNFTRKRGIGEKSIGNWDDKTYITSNGDTLVRSLALSMNTHEILYESSYLHGQKNGLEIAYFPNGIVREINYYLDGKLWEAVSRSDSAGRLLNPGTLHNGDGTKFSADHLGLNPNCFETYKNGLPEGPFFMQTGTSTTVKGNLTYKKSAVNYLPAKRVVYTGPTGEKATGTFENNEFRSIFSDTSNHSDFKLISVAEDSVPERPREFMDLSIGFDDPAVIPRGNWNVIDLNTGKVIKSIDFDDNGNAIKVIAFKKNGEVSLKREFSPCNKRKTLRTNPDGSFLDESCLVGK